MIPTSPLSDSRNVARRSFATTPPVLGIPNLIQVQFDSFRRFLENGLRELFEGLAIQDLAGTRLELRFVNCELGPPKNSIPA